MARFLPRSATLPVIAALAAVAPAGSASAQATLLDGLGGPLGYGEACLGPNDDGSSEPIDLSAAFPGGLNFFGTTFTELYVNTNGNVSFGGPLPRYTPRAFPAATRPLIAPYWADVDIRFHDGACDGSAGSGGTAPACHSPPDNGVWWAVEPGRIVVTWHEVGYYDCHVDKRMSFQLVITGPAVPMCAMAGDFDVEFRYARCEWTTGDRSGGVGGLGGVEAQAGFDAGNGVDFVEIPASRTPAIARTLCTSSNVGEPGVWRFRIRSGEVVCADAGRPCDTGMPGICALGRTVCIEGRTECRQAVAPREERCNGLDDDCDGEVDEPSPGGSLCDADLGERCERGRCTTPCTEFGCAPGFVCTEEGRCVDEACLDVTCGAGERCVLGSCIGPCEGVRCPTGQACFAGRCVDLCEGVDCGDCGVCEEGRCVERCQVAGCPEGEACQADGRCVPAACEGVRCGEGERCDGTGRCVDLCEGAACPYGERCVAGRCEPIPPAPVAEPAPDAGSGRDAGRSGRDAASDGAAEAGASSPAGPAEPGCACRAEPGAGGDWALALLLVGLLLRRRR